MFNAECVFNSVRQTNIQFTLLIANLCILKLHRGQHLLNSVVILLSALISVICLCSKLQTVYTTKILLLVSFLWLSKAVVLLFKSIASIAYRKRAIKLLNLTLKMQWEPHHCVFLMSLPGAPVLENPCSCYEIGLTENQKCTQQSTFTSDNGLSTPQNHALLLRRVPNTSICMGCFDASKQRIAALTGPQYQYVHGAFRRLKTMHCCFDFPPIPVRAWDFPDVIKFH